MTDTTHDPIKAVVLNESDSALDAFCMSRGTSIVYLDEKLAELPHDNVNKRELMRLRRMVADAHQRNDVMELDGWIHALMIGLKAACHTIPLAIHGEGMRKNEKKNPGGPVRRRIARELAKAKNPDELKPRHLWELLKAKHPKTWDFEGQGKERRIWITGRPSMGYGQFSDVCKEERDKLKS